MSNSKYDLTLFYFPGCPYCKKVLNFMKDKNIEIQLKNIRKNREAARKLKEIGGKKQVPCLFINGKPLYESDDIIVWLKEHYL